MASAVSLEDRGFQPIPVEALERSLVHRFESQVERDPTRLAVKARERSLSYGDLNAQANRLARTILQARGSGAEPVVLLLSADVTIGVGIWGVLKAGKFFVPLDPAHPAPHLATIARNAEANLIVAERRSADVAEAVVAAGGAQQVVYLDEIDGSIPESNLDLPIQANDRALVYYTSGTTGQPKGASRTHRHVLNAARNDTDVFQFQSDDRIALVVSYSFGASRKEIFGAWLNGAALCVFDVRSEGFTNLASWIDSERITLYSSTPTLFRHMLSMLPATGRLESVRALSLSGEPAYRQDIDLYRRHFGDHCVLVHRYAATESGEIATLLIDRNTQFDDAIIPVGYPGRGKTVLLLDEAGQPVTEGQVGEIVVVAKLMPNAHGQAEGTPAAWRQLEDGAWAYHTGDLGRFRPDGMLECRGRRDHQVKIRGQRVNLMDVEAALSMHEAVQSVVVIAADSPVVDEQAIPEKELVAYIVADDVPSIGELRRFLADRLPAAMHPSLVMPVDSIPLTRTGKVDQKALPRPDWARRVQRTTPIRPPANWIETRLVALWSELLGVSEVDTADNFFDLGGSSLTAARMLATVENEFGREIGLAALEKHATVSGLAALIGQLDAVKPRSPIIEVKPSGTRSPLFCVPASRGYTLDFFSLAKYVDRDQPVYAFQQRGLDGVGEPYLTFDEMVSDYLERVRQIQPVGPYYLCGRSFGGVVAYEMAQRLVAAGERVNSLFLLDTEFNSGPRLRKKYPFQVLQMAYQALNVFRKPSREWRAELRAVYRQWKKLTRDEFIQAPAQRIVRLNRKFYRHYVVRPYSGRVIYLSARATRRTSEREDRWAAVVTGEFVLVDVSGGHVGMLQEPHVRRLAIEMARYLSDR